MSIACLSFALGIAWLQQQAALPDFARLAALLAAALACAAAAFALPGKPRLALAACSAAALGFVWAAGIAHWRIADRLDASLEGIDLTVVGVVSSLPVLGERSLRFEFDIEAAHGPETPLGVRLPRRVQLAWYRSAYRDASALDAPSASLEAAQQVQPGQRWRFTVRLKRPHGNLNPHGFDYEAWLLERGIGATGYVRPRGGQTLLGARKGFMDRIEQARAAVRARFLAVLGDTPGAGVLVALAVGDQRAIDAAHWRLFSRTGVTHLMSISGLHVTLISGLVAALVSFFWRRNAPLALCLPARKAAAAAAVLTALGYTLLAGFGVPAQRTLFMVGAVAAALWCGRIGAPMRVLCLALLAVLLVDPWALLAAGFWLSFGAVALIFYVSQGWVGRERRVLQWARIQWAITVGLAPATLLLFGQVSLVGPLANAVAIPLVSAIITPLVLLAALIPLDALLQLAERLVAALLGFLRWCDALPLALWQQPAPAAWSVLVALAGIAWLLAPRGMPARWLGLLLLLPVLGTQAPRPAPGEAWLTFLDVGQGLAVLVQTAGHALLYDAGPAYGGESDSGERVIAPLLRAVGATRLDRMILTHNDSDHIGGALSVMMHAQVVSLISALPPAHPAAARMPLASRCERGERWRWDGVDFALLHPAAEDYSGAGLKANNLSCVLRIRSAHGSVLLTGDIEKAAESLLLARGAAAADVEGLRAAAPELRADVPELRADVPELRADVPELRADVLLMPHHGSRTSSTAEFLAAVRPGVAVAAAGYRNRFGHPREDVLARYDEIGARVLRTDLDGAVGVRLAGGRVQALGERAARPRYWRSQRL